MKTKDLGKSVLYTLTESLVTLLSSIVTAFVVARLIGPSAFGIASIAYLVGSLAESIMAVAFTEAVIRRKHYDAWLMDTAFTAMLMTGIVLSAAISLLSPIIAWLYGAPELALLVGVQGFTCILLGLRGIPEAALARKLRFRALAMRGIAAKVTSAALSIGLAFAGWGAWSLVLGNIAFGLAATTMIFAVSARWPRIHLDRPHLRELLSFGRFSVADSLFGAATPRLYQAIIAYFGGPVAAGQIGIAFRINDAVGALIGAVTVRMALPVFSRLASLERTEFQRIVLRGMGLVFAIAAPFFIGIALLSPGIVELVMGPEWAGAAAPLVAVSLFSVCNFAIVVSGPVMKALGRPARAALVPALGLAFVVVGAFVTAPWGLAAQLGVWSGFGLVYLITSAINLRQIAGIAYTAQMKALSGTVLSCVLMAAVVATCGVLASGLALWLTLCLQVMSGAVSYGLASLILQREMLAAMISTFRAGRAPGTQ